jgi:hypothetical protein
MFNRKGRKESFDFEMFNRKGRKDRVDYFRRREGRKGQHPEIN